MVYHLAGKKLNSLKEQGSGGGRQVVEGTHHKLQLYNCEITTR